MSEHECCRPGCQESVRGKRKYCSPECREIVNPPAQRPPCASCGTALTKRRKYCDACRRNMGVMIELTCDLPDCNNTFVRYGSVISHSERRSQKHNFCSAECYHKSRARKFTCDPVSSISPAQSSDSATLAPLAGVSSLAVTSMTSRAAA